MSNYEDYSKAEFGDKRLSDRLQRLLEQLAGNPAASISAACQDPYQAKAIYRFLANEDVTTKAITNITRDVTIANINAAKPSVLLIPEDTTEINFTTLRATEGLGVIGGSEKLRGLFAHSAIGISESGEIYGLLSQKIWARPPESFGQNRRRANLPIEQKESYKWLEIMLSAQEGLPEDIFAVHVCDREADMYELFCKAEEINANYLCRICYNRIVSDEEGLKNLDDYIASLPVAGTVTVRVPRDSHTGRIARNAELEIMYGKCTIPKPIRLARTKDLSESVEVYVVSAVEIDPPQGQERIFWKLITNVATKSFKDAVVRISWYTQRWKIETFHRTLKSGCKVEELQSETADNLIKLIAIYSIIALQIMLITYVARTQPEESCEICFTEDEWKVLYRAAKRTKDLPEKPPTIYEAVIMIAKLGGFLGRKSDGFPGVTVIWRGLTSLYTILDVAPFLV